MTLHIVLLPATEPKTLVWITDILFAFSPGSVTGIEKIVYLESHSIACSAYGDYALTLRDELVQRIQSGDLDVSSPDQATASMKAFCQRILPSSTPSKPALLLATFVAGMPRLYWGQIAVPSVASELEMGNCLGDEINPAKVFVDYYWERSGKSVEEALTLGIHAMRLAHEIKRAYIGEPDAWIYREGVFRRLTSAEIAPYIAASKSIDAAVLQKRT
jgi:hypothetical protein